MLKYILPLFFSSPLTAAFTQNAEEQIELTYTETKKRIPFFAEPGHNSIEICGLEKGREYSFRTSMEGGLVGELSLHEGGALLQKGTPNMLVVTVADECIELLLKTDIKTKDAYAVLSISELADGTSISTKSDNDKMAGITTQEGIGAATLINEVFIGGDCFDADGISPIGEADGKGTFGNGQAFIGFEEGVILASGDLVNVEGPNNTPDATTTFSPFIEFDPDLFQLGGGWPLFDIVGIEFDFYPTDTLVEFEYVFASEEYCEYVHSQFNDVFGFFISGPGINGGFSNGAINLATIAGTNTPVSINSINDIDNNGYYVDNVPPGHAPWLWGAACATAGASPAAAAGGFGFDGFTVPMTARAKVIPCEKYHIKLVVADVGDPLLDAAVFLKANSFGGTPIYSSVFSGGTTTDEAQEGCETAGFVFTRDSTNIDSSFVVNFEIDTTSTALEGIDFDSLPSSVTILPGEVETILPVHILTDFLAEGQESIVLNVDEACSCEETSVTLFLNDLPPLELAVAGASICEGESLALTPVVSGGVGPYEMEWGNGQSGTSLTVSPSEDMEYTVTVRDSCGQEVSISAMVLVNQGVQATLSGQLEVCGDTFSETWPVHFTNGVPPYAIGYTINGGPTVVVNDIDANPFLLPINETGVYELVFVEGTGCQGLVSGSLNVLSSNITSTGSVENTSCFGENDGQINAGAPSGGFVPYTYNWSHVGMGDAVQDSLLAGTYEVTITDGIGCELIQAFEVQQPPPLTANIYEVEHLDCINSGGSLKMEAHGGTPDYSFLWSNGSTTGNISDLPAGSFKVTITDENGCEALDSATIMALDEVPNLEAIADTITCQKEDATLNGMVLNTSGNFNLEWRDQYFNILSSSPNVTVGESAPYFFIGENTDNGCRDTIEIEVKEDLEQPFITINEPDTLTCLLEEVELYAVSTVANPSYNWTILNAGNITSLTDQAVITVNAPGDYVVEIMNPQNGCTNLAYTLVKMDTMPPVPNIIPTGTVINCDQPLVQADASSSQPGGYLLFTWSDSNGVIVSDPNASLLDVDAAGDYWLTLTNMENGCTDGLVFQVTDDLEPPQITLSDPLTLTCDLEETTLTASSNVSAVNYEWTAMGGGQVISSAGQPEITVNAAGQYTVEVVNPQNGCVDSASVWVEMDTLAPMVFIAPPNDLNCNDVQVTLDATASSTGTVFTYLWTPDQMGNIVSGGNTLTPLVNASGIYSLLVENTENGCVQLTAVTVGIDTAAPVASAIAVGKLNCLIDQLNLDGYGSSTGGAYDYSWQGPGVLSGSNTLFPVINIPGEYFLKVTNLLNGCKGSASVLVEIDTVPPVALIASPDDLNCSVTEVVLDGTGSSAGSTIEYLWTTDQSGHIVNGHSTLTPLIDAGGTYVLLVENTDNGCTQLAEVTVGADTIAPIATASVLGELNCIVDQLALDGSGSSVGSGFSYSWEGPGLLADANTLSPSVNLPGEYELTVLDAQNGCMAIVAISVVENTDVPTGLEYDFVHPTCVVDGSINILQVIGGTEDYTYSLDGQTFGEVPDFEDLAAGLYTLYVRDSIGCEYQEEVELEAPIALDVILEPSIDTIEIGEDYLLSPVLNIPPSAIGSILWSPAEFLSCTECLTPTAIPVSDIIYQVIITSTDFCLDSAALQLIVQEKPGVYIPNAFSPANFDGINDAFTVYTGERGVEKIKSLYVFSRWGELVYSVFNFPPNDPAFGWDGTFRGKMMDPAVFAYFTEVEFVDGDTKIYKGDVTLIR